METTKGPTANESPYDVVIIGSGFGGTMTALTLAHKLKDKAPRMLILERGTWWTTPVSTVQDKSVRTYTFLQDKKQPVQFWPAVEHFKGVIDILLRCVRRPGNQDGLYDMMHLGKRGLFLGIGAENDGVSILRASGVGGGSLIYSNITIQPPDFVLKDERWPLTWSDADRDQYYNLARHAIGYGVVSAWTEADAVPPNIPFHNPDRTQPKGAINAGLSNIVTRSARLNPNWPSMKRLQTDFILRQKELDQLQNLDGVPVAICQKLQPLKDKPFQDQDSFLLAVGKALTPEELKACQTRIINRAQIPTDYRYWIDRARIFQGAMRKMTNDFGTVDSAINEITPEGSPLDPTLPANYPGPAINYCERQGRCNVGCLPGARHTLNKQLMRAIHGAIDGKGPQFPNLSLQALAEVDVIRAAPDGYQIDYSQRDAEDPEQTVPVTITARKVIIAAGCVGTNELLLRCKERGTLPNLSDKVGFGFSTNGDYIAFADDLREGDGVSPRLVSLARGPVTTSFGHFHTAASALTPQDNPDPEKFHTLEDQGIPRALASTIGFGKGLMRRLAFGKHQCQRWLVFLTLICWAWHRLIGMVAAYFKDPVERQNEFKSEDELTHNMMCVVAQGREASIGQFTLGKRPRESSLRVARPHKQPFCDDPIYDEIRKTLARMGPLIGAKKDFQNPFLEDVAKVLKQKTIATTHPLGGCRMGQTAAEGVVDEFGRVFDKTKQGSKAFYDGLYVADASMIPTALGVNPSLTISALSLRIAESIASES